MGGGVGPPAGVVGPEAKSQGQGVVAAAPGRAESETM